MKKVLVIMVGLITVGLILGGGIWLSGHTKLSAWNGKTRIGVAFFLGAGEETDVVLLSYQPDGEAVWMSVPGDTKIRISRGYGEYPLRSLWKLSMQENDKRILDESITLLLGTPFEEWMYIDQEKINCESKDWNCLKSALGYAQKHPELSSNMPWWDRVRLASQVNGLDANSVLNLDFGRVAGASIKAQADGEPLLIFSDELLESRIGAKLVDTKVRDEEMTIKVVNTLSVAGLGAQIERIIVGMGGRVVAVESNRTDLEKCKIKGSARALASVTAKRLLNLWECDSEDGAVDPKVALEFWTGKDTGEWLIGDNK